MFRLNVGKWINLMSACIMLIITAWNLRTFNVWSKFPKPRGTINAFIEGVDSRTFGVIVLLAVWNYIYATRNDFSYMRILQMKDRRSIWLSSCRQIALYVLAVTTAVEINFLICGAIIYGHNGFVPDALKGEMLSVIIIKSYLLCLLQIMCSVMFTAFILWVFNTYYPALVTLAAISLSDAHPLFWPIFYSRFTYDDNMFIRDNAGAAGIIIKLLIIAFLIAAAGYLVAERKEFMSVDSNKK